MTRQNVCHVDGAHTVPGVGLLPTPPVLTGENRCDEPNFVKDSVRLVDNTCFARSHQITPPFHTTISQMISHQIMSEAQTHLLAQALWL